LQVNRVSADDRAANARWRFVHVSLYKFVAAHFRKHRAMHGRWPNPFET
jgi:hypothetical protein